MKYQRYIVFFPLCVLFLYSNHGVSQTDLYRVMWNDDPTTTATIGWEDKSETPSTVYYDTKSHGQDIEEYEFRQEVDARYFFGELNNSFARLTQLKPATCYYFVIGNEKVVSAPFYFETAPASPDERLSFIAGGDSRNNRVPRQNANVLVAKLMPHGVLFGGDMTNGDSEGEWREWLRDWQLTIAEDGRCTPIMAARGNHERSNYSIQKIFDTNIDVYGAITFGGNLLKVYTLNTESVIGGDQAAWLERDLETSCGLTWKMAQYHKPIRPHVSFKREGNSQYQHWAHLFYEYNVNLVVECDAHVVKTTWPVRPSRQANSEEGFIRDDEYGTVFIGEGCWGAPLRGNNDAKIWTRESGSFNQIKWIFVDSEKMEVRTVLVGETAQTDSINSIDPNNRFAVPQYLKLWNPPSGEVVTIKKPGMDINIVSPVQGSAVNSFPAYVIIDAEATDTDEEIRQVDFYVNGEFKGSMTTPPYKYQWVMAVPGDYDMQAVAIDNSGNEKFSCPVHMVGDNSILGLDWVAFEVNHEKNRGMVIQWKAEQENGTDYFLVERAGEDRKFSTIYKQQCDEGNSSETSTYLHLDDKPLSGKSYYRLRAVNKDGVSTLSQIVKANLAASFEYYIHAYPNPIGNDKVLNIEATLPKREKVDIYLFDGSGKETLFAQKIMKKGKQIISINTGPIPGGIYYLKVIFAETAIVKKIIFQ